MKKIVLFDIDGTLLLTGGAGKVAFERAFLEIFGLADAWGGTVPDGKTDPLIFDEILSRVLPEPPAKDVLRQLYARYTEYFRSEIKRSPRFRLMPGIPDLLKTLDRDPRFLLGVATGNIEEVSWLKLEHGGLRGFFRFGGFGSDSAERKEILERALERAALLNGPCDAPGRHTVVIGDAPQDILAARALGIRTISVATGGTPKKTLASHRPDYLLDDLADTNALLEILSSTV